VNQQRILIVEDDRVTRNALVSLFISAGMVAVEAGSLKAALTLLDGQFDLICLDLRLPDGNGVELLRKVREEKLRSSVAVISGANEANTLSEVTRLKPDAIFGKPLDVHDFLDWLGSLNKELVATSA
jgi:DNA-binding response OmpR family regulator